MTAVRAFLRTNQDSLLTFLAMAGERVLQMFVGLYVAGSIARGFSHEQFAAWQVAYSLFVVVSAVCDVAHERVVLPRLCSTEGRRSQVLWNSILVTKYLAGFAAVAMLVIWAARAGQDDVLPLALLWSVYLLMGEPVSLAVFELYAKDNFTKPQLTRIAATAVRLVVVVAVVELGGGLTWMVVAWLAEMTLMLAILCRGWLSGGRVHPSLVDWSLVRTITLQGSTLALAAAATVALTRVERLVLNAAIPTDVLSQYVASMSILEAAFAFSGTLLTVLGAKILFRPEKITWSLHAQLAMFAVAVAVLGAAFITMIADPLVRFVFGANYAGSAHYLRIGAWLLPFVFVQAILQAPLLVRASKRFHLVKSALALAIGVAVASAVASAGLYDLIASGAYAGFVALIVADLLELRRRSAQIYDRRAR